MAVPAGDARAGWPGERAGVDLSSSLAEAQDGDPEAFRVLYRDTQPRLLRYLHVFRGDYDGFRGWVVTIARHRALDHLRRSRRRPAVPVPVEELTGLAAGDDTAEGALTAVATDAAVRLIATLPRDQAEAVLLRAVVGLDSASAGRVLGKRPGAVRTAASRGLSTLARTLEQPGHIHRQARSHVPGRDTSREEAGSGDETERG
jgi:RNA polymerase sigma-70 factor (ECF subfamily)